MKKRLLNIQITIALLAIVVLSVAIICGCGAKGFLYKDSEPIGYGPDISDPEDSVGVENDTDNDSDDILETDISLFADGATEFEIVISDNASESLAEAAGNIKTAFASKLGVSIKLRNENYFKIFNNGSLKGPKIVVGTLNGDSISNDIEKPLRDGEYMLKVTDGSLYIIGGTEESTVQAVNYFINVFVKNKNTPISFKPGVVYEKTTSASVINMTISSNEIWKYRIVYKDTVFGKACAQRVQDAIAKSVGYTLPMVSDEEEETFYEILVGKTNRAASKEVRETYVRPNVNYDIKTVGSKLVIMGEGYLTLSAVAEVFEGYIAAMGGFGTSINGSVRSGNILHIIDKDSGESMTDRLDGTDIRVLHWNMAAPYLNSEFKIYTDNTTRGEIMADIILQMYPDFLTTNEFYRSHNGDSTLYNAVMGELSEYYYIVESEYEKDKPETGADAIAGKTINSNILYKISAGFTLIDSGWRYSGQKIEPNDDNPGGWIYYHGSHTAAFKTYYGDKLVISTAQYSDSRSDSQWAREQLAAVADIKERNSLDDDISVILTGDMYTSYSSPSPESAYKYLVGQGYVDSQRNAELNANVNMDHGTLHDIGKRQTNRIAGDLIWTKNNLTTLKFKVLTSDILDDVSDHYPVIADLKLN